MMNFLDFGTRLLARRGPNRCSDCINSLQMHQKKNPKPRNSDNTIFAQRLLLLAEKKSIEKKIPLTEMNSEDIGG